MAQDNSAKLSNSEVSHIRTHTANFTMTDPGSQLLTTQHCSVPTLRTPGTSGPPAHTILTSHTWHFRAPGTPSELYKMYELAEAARKKIERGRAPERPCSPEALRSFSHTLCRDTDRMQVADTDSFICNDQAAMS